MKVLSIDTSSKVCGVALVEDDIVIGAKELNNGRTHSENLMPLIEKLLEENNVDKNEIELVAVNIGPGSFTGIRIGVASAKAIATALQIPLVGVNSLEALQYNVYLKDFIFKLYKLESEEEFLINKNNINEKIEIKNMVKDVLCSVIDAKHEQVYFSIFNNNYKELDIGACSLEELLVKLSNYNDIVLIGDGITAYKDRIVNSLPQASITIINLQYQSSISLATVAINKFKSDDYDKRLAVNPLYLKKSQAERVKESK